MKLFFSFLSVAILSPVLALAEIDYKQIQTDLNRMGYKVGSADGIPGRNTRRGIKEFFNDAGYVAPTEVTLSEQSFIHDVAEFADKPIGFIRDVITGGVNIEGLSDSQLCDLNFHIDLMPVFEEIAERGLSCTSGTSKTIRYSGALLNDPIKLLRDFQKSNAIDIPNINLTASQKTFADFDEVQNLYHQANPELFRLVARRSVEDEYCSKFLPTLGSIPPDPTKTLDGSGSWYDDTMRDGITICQGGVNALYLYSLSFNRKLSRERVKDFQELVENLVARDGANNLPFRPMRSGNRDRGGLADPNFTHLITISKIMTGVELLHSQFNWSDTQYARYADWARDKILQRLPVGGRIEVLKDGVCSLNPTKNESNDSCMNAAPLVAQGLLRAAIMGNDQELAELSYLVFKQYLSGIRLDGSQAADSLRDCYAADYTIWAAQFLHDYVYLASTVGLNLWDHRFSERYGSVTDNMEYALKVRSDPSHVNQYAQNFGYPDCERPNGEIIQKTTTYPWASFAGYLFEHDRDRFENFWLEKRDKLHNYTAQSGVNYEIDLLLRHPEIVDYFYENEAAIFERREREEENRRKEALKAKLASLGFKGITGDDPYAGKYKARWFYRNVNRPENGSEYQSTDTLTLEGGIGFFAGEQQFSQPSSRLRKQLFVIYDETGKIMIEGDLDLYEKDEVHMIELDGRLDQTKGPEITGLWPGGDIFEIELERLD